VANTLRLPLPIRQYAALLRAGFRAELQYRANAVLQVLGAVAYQGTSLAFVGILLHRFGTLGGWGFREIAFLYGMRLLSHAVYTVPFAQLGYVDFVIQNGEFDRYLLRPVNPFVQLLTRRFTLLALGDLVLGISLLVIVSVQAPVAWTPLHVLYLIAAVIGGGMVESGVHTGLGALTFRLLSTGSLKAFADEIFTVFGAYPLNVMGRVVSYGLTFLVPLAFIGYFPATILLGRSGELYVPTWLAGAAPAFGFAIFWAGYRLFIHQSRYYSSPGS